MHVRVYADIHLIDPTFRKKINSALRCPRPLASRSKGGRWPSSSPHGRLGPNLSCDTSFRRSAESAIRQRSSVAEASVLGWSRRSSSTRLQDDALNLSSLVYDRISTSANYKAAQIHDSEFLIHYDISHMFSRPRMPIP